MSRWIRTAFFMQIHTFRPQFHHSGPKTPQISWKFQKWKMSLLTFSELFSKKMPLTKILRPNLWAKNDPMVILSLSTFREKVRFDCIFPIDIPFFMENHFFILSRLGFILNGFCSPLNVFLSYYYFLFLAPWPWLLGPRHAGTFHCKIKWFPQKLLS